MCHAWAKNWRLGILHGQQRINTPPVPTGRPPSRCTVRSALPDTHSNASQLHESPQQHTLQSSHLARWGRAFQGNTHIHDAESYGKTSHPILQLLKWMKSFHELDNTRIFLQRRKLLNSLKCHIHSFQNWVLRGRDWQPRRWMVQPQIWPKWSLLIVTF